MASPRPDSLPYYHDAHGHADYILLSRVLGILYELVASCMFNNIINVRRRRQ